MIPPSIPLGVEDEETERDEAHVRDGRIRDELLHVLLHQRHQADVHHRDERQRDHQARELVRSVGRDRKREAQEAVGTHLQHDRRQDHRTAGRRLDVRVRQPGMHRPHRHLDRERRQEREEDQHLLGEADLEGVERLNLETVRLEIKVDERHQHQHRADEGVEEKLDGGVDAVRPAPQADDKEHRHQHLPPRTHKTGWHRAR